MWESSREFGRVRVRVGEDGGWGRARIKWVGWLQEMDGVDGVDVRSRDLLLDDKYYCSN